MDGCSEWCGMDEPTRALVRVSVALATRGSDIGPVLRAAAAAAEPLAVEEALLQSYLFLGYPTALRALAEWRRVSSQAPPPARRDEAEWERRGAATCAVVYGGQYPRLRSNIAALHPDMEQWMLVEGYGKVLSRPGLDLATRELCIIGLLAPQDAGPQLYSHLRGALNAGAAEADVGEAVELIMPLLDAERSGELLKQWTAVRGRRGVTTTGE